MVQSASRIAADDAVASARPLTIVSVPADHAYVRRISASAGVDVLPDPTVPGAPPGTWWPPAALDPAWIRRNRRSADLLHIHFGTESFPPGHVAACIDAAHGAGWPVVFTVHDLEHPQLHGQEAYRRQLDELVTGADAIVTLTPGAAAVIRDRWARDAVVIPHPSLAENHPRSAGTSGDVRIGLHLKDLRPNVDGPRALEALLAATAVLREEGVRAVAVVRMHRRVRDDAARDEVRRLCANAPDAALVEHERLDDAELAVALSGLDACVLPYRHGTHSGWLELCWDLGVPVAAPTVGHYLEQHDDGTVAGFRPDDGRSLASALAALLHSPDATRSGSPERSRLVAARRAIRARTDAAAADAHARLYRRLLAERDS